MRGTSINLANVLRVGVGRGHRAVVVLSRVADSPPSARFGLLDIQMRGGNSNATPELVEALDDFERLAGSRTPNKEHRLALYLFGRYTMRWSDFSTA